MRPSKPPTFDALLTLIAAATSVADLTALVVTARTYFAGTQREALEAAAAKRLTELPN